MFTNTMKYRQHALLFLAVLVLGGLSWLSAPVLAESEELTGVHAALDAPDNPQATTIDESTFDTLLAHADTEWPGGDLCADGACNGSGDADGDDDDDEEEDEEEEEDDLKPSWPSPASRCRRDNQCDVGLVCETLDIRAWPPVEIPNGAPRNGSQVCQPGCRIDEVFYYPAVRDASPNECQWCDPAADRYAWTDMATGTACGDPTDTACDNPDTCDGAGTCLPNHEAGGDAVTCGDAGTACTKQDYCDGAGGCTDSGYVEIDTPCGSSNTSDCDDADTCDGSGNCQTNNEADGTACTSDNNECTSDVCASGVCTYPSATFGTACGSSSASDCDQADTCDGDGNCLENFVPEGFVCGDPSDTDCDNPDACDGQGMCLSNLEEAGAACGDQTDTECNAPDTCNGLGDCLDNFEPAGQTCGDLESACTNMDTCNGAGSCTDNGYKNDTTPCIGTSDGGPCDDDASDHCSGTDNTCVDAYRPNTTVCRESTALCDAEETCDGASGACPDDGLLASGTPCRAAAGPCDIAETCDGASASCPDDAYQPSTYACVSGECKEDVFCTGTDPLCPNFTPVFDSGTPCRPSTGLCDPPEFCATYGVCAPDEQLAEGAECGHTAACELPDTCDANGVCVDNGYRSATASCRAPANGCDAREYCGACDDSGNCSGGFAPGDPRNRADYTNYPECGPDLAIVDDSDCNNGGFPGSCFAGECITIEDCRFDIDCPDGYVCDEPNCVEAPVEHGLGDLCAGQKFCDPNSPNPGSFCNFPVDCQDAEHPGGNCVPSIFGDCADGLVCCTGMGGDGDGVAAAVGQFGRCQECCATDLNDVTPWGCGDNSCCDGRCTDTSTDIHNCGGCAANGGLDCTNLVDACSPSVLECDLGISQRCIMASFCDDPDVPLSVYDICEMTDTITVPDPACAYCDPMFTFDETKHNMGCYTDADCGTAPEIPGSCHRVAGRCRPDSANPNQECSLDSDCQDAAHPNGDCHDYCWSLFVFAAGSPTVTVPVGDCSTPPYDGCTVTCTPVVNPGDIANVGDECDNDDDCFGGTHCEMSCDVSNLGVTSFCFSPNTCQW